MSEAGPETWKEIDRLVGEQKLEAAAKLVDARVAAADEARNDDELARALVRRAQLRIALGGFATAVEALRASRWPEKPLAHAAVELYYAHALLDYLEAYDWEIRQRELVVSGETLDLERWTAAQLADEAERAFLDVWESREALGAVAVDDFPYLRPNDFPEGIRDTLRDAVSYLFVERMLGNSRFWSAAESNEAWQLDLENLIADRPVVPATGPVHPLLRAAVVLADLEAWHRGRRELGAELQARIARQATIADHREGATDRGRLRAELERRLPRYRDDPWWAVGVADLAGDIDRDDPAPDHRIRARELTLRGEQAYPGSYGADRCRQLREEIEAPDFSVQAMSSDGPRERSFEVTHRNLPRLHFRAFRVDPDAELGRAEFRGVFPNDAREIERRLADRPVAEWTAELPPTPDYSSHRTFDTPPLAEAGLYFVVASADRSFRARGNRRVAVPFLVSDLVLLEGAANENPWEVRVVSGGSGAAIAGAEVALYRNTWRRAPERIATEKSGADGRARLAAETGRDATNFLVVARRGGDIAFSQRYLYGRRSEPSEQTAALVFTDRAIYRPLQKVEWKILGYRSGPARGRLVPSPRMPATVSLLDPNGEEVQELAVTTNEFGTAAGAFEIPAGRLLGLWTVRTTANGSASIRVEEYKRPTFEVEIGEPDSALRLNRVAELVGNARYYFGLPVAGGRVAWRVTRTPEWPVWWRFWAPPGGATEAQTIASGVAPLSDDGTFRVRFTPAADEREKTSGATYRYRLEADVTDDGGETRSGDRTFRLGWVAVEATLEKEDPLFVAGEAMTVVATRRDLDGVARPGSGSFRLVALDVPARAPLPAALPVRPAHAAAKDDPYATPGDALRPRWSGGTTVADTLAFYADGREVRRGELAHDARGRSTIDLAGVPAGAYRLRYATTDPFGETFENRLDFVVAATAGGGAKLALPAAILFDRGEARPGDTARLWVHSDLGDAPAEVELHRGDEIVWRKQVRLRGTTWFDVPVAEADRGGLAARLVLVAEHQLMAPGVSLAVPWTNRELAVEISSLRDKLTPGGRESFRVTVKDAKGRAVEAGAAELLASMYDRSLDLFAPFSQPRPIALFPTTTSLPPVQSSLGTTGAVWIRDEEWVKRSVARSVSGDSFVEISPYGIGGPGGRFRRFGGYARGGVAMADAAMPASAPPPPQPLAKEAEADQGTAVAESLAVRSEAPTADVPLRSNFAETAFWRPQLLTGADGSATIEFTVPDSVTSWRLWVSALTKSFASGFSERQVDSVKELMVRPYLPRFLREGDRAELKVVVNDAGDSPLSGTARLEIFDPETNESLLGEFGLDASSSSRPFRVEPGRGVDLLFPLAAPHRVGPTAFKVTATAGNLSDGELRPLPVLPSRIRLAQSRFVTLKNADRREMTFDEMKLPDPTRENEQLVVTVDGQLFYSMLDALPYLVDYPYECTEQTMNRFVSTGMLASLFDGYPALAAMAAEMAERETPYERFDAADPNRSMGLEETPWLRESRGSAAGAEGVDFLRVLDPTVSRAERDDALAKLAKAQLPNGGFPWFSGGPASPYITLYLASGFARAAEFGVDVPKPMVQRAWSYLGAEAKRDWLPKAIADDCCWELLTFLNYVASSYPDESWVGDFLEPADRKRILDFSFKHWKEHAPLLKLQLALTLQRAGRPADAKLVLASVMDSAKTTRDEGTFWQPEDRSWLWYNDRIETHAWALRALMEITPDDPRRDGLVQWLFLNKKLNHWKSTRATAEVLYSLAWYLRATNQLAVREEASVTAAHRTTTFVFEPERFTGRKNQVVVEGAKLDAEKRPADATVVVEKTTPGLLFASATWRFSTEELPAEARGDLFEVTRRYFRRVKTGDEVTLRPLDRSARLAVGDEVEVQLSVRAKAAAEYVHLRDPRPAGLEPDRAVSGWKWDLGLARYEETRDSGSNFFFERLPAGEYTMKYRLRANLAGEFRSAPAQLQSIYAPEFVAYSAGERLVIASP